MHLKPYYLLAIFCFCFGTLAAEIPQTASTQENQELSASEMEAYYSSLQAQIDQQNVRVEALIKRAQSGQQVPTPVQRVEIEQAIMMLDVKKTLYNNFYDTRTIKQSAAVRRALLQILSQFDITIVDLSGFQNLVTHEKERLGIN